VTVLLLCSFYEISMTVDFVPLRDFNDSLFCSVYEISMTFSFQCQSVLFCYEILKMVGFVIFFFYDIQRQLILFCYKISVMVSFVLL